MRRVNMEAVASELEEVKAAMVETAQMIDRVEKEIAETVRLELQAKASNDAEELRAMREKENKLREEKNKLREEKNKLREKENKLREKENKLREMEMYLLQRRDSEAAAEAVVGLFYWPQVFEMVDPSSSIPDAAQMGAFVESMLPNGGIPVPLDITIPPIFAGSFYNRRLHSSDTSVVAQMLTPTFTVTSGSEMQMQLNWDRFFTALSRLAVTHDVRYQLSRNTASNSLSGITEASRPDFLLLVNGKALLFGEEKSEPRQIGDAARELSEKLRWDSFTLGISFRTSLGMRRVVHTCSCTYYCGKAPASQSRQSWMCKLLTIASGWLAQSCTSCAYCRHSRGGFRSRAFRSARRCTVREGYRSPSTATQFSRC